MKTIGARYRVVDWGGPQTTFSDPKETEIVFPEHTRVDRSWIRRAIAAEEGTQVDRIRLDGWGRVYAEKGGV